MAEGNVTKRAFAQALIRLCQDKPYEKVTVQDICRQTGLKRQTFYYHFKDKQALLRWFYQADSLCYIKASDMTLDNWEEAAFQMLKAMLSQGAFYHETVSAVPDVLMREFSGLAHQLFVRLFEEVDQEKVLSTEDKDFYARFLSYGCNGILIDWIQGSFSETPLEIAAQLFRFAKDIEFFSNRLYQQEEEK